MYGIAEVQSDGGLVPKFDSLSGGCFVQMCLKWTPIERKVMAKHTASYARKGE